MYDDLRAHLTAKGLTTHLFYLDDLIDNQQALTDEDYAHTWPNVFDALTLINTQASIDLWFQEHHDSPLDYCILQDDGTWACMLVETQVEYIVRADFEVISQSDGMGNE